MTLVSIFSGRRLLPRSLILLALTLLLHVVLIEWLGTHLGAPGAVATPSTPVEVQLRLEPPPKPAPPPAPPKPKPLPRPKARPKPAPVLPPVPAPEAASAVVTTDAAADTGADGGTAAGTGDAPASASASVPATVAAPPAPPETAPASAPPPAPAAPHYKVALPASADFELDVQHVDAKGRHWNGEAVMSWQQDGRHYKAGQEVGVSILVTRINLLVLHSEGDIDADGIAPLTSTEKRKGRALTTTRFDRGEQGKITFSASDNSYPLTPGAQDKATVLFQLAGIGKADVNQLQGDIDILVGEDKSADVFRFRLVGEDEIDTKMGRLVTWHLARPARKGTYSSSLDVWLAPSLGWYPVKISNLEASGALTTQTVSKITLK